MRRLLLCACFLATIAAPGCHSRPEPTGPDQSGIADLSSKDLTSADLLQVAPLAFLEIDSLFQNCMPIVNPDPLLLKGRITVRNQNDAPLGPVIATDGVILDKDGAQLATFSIKELMLGVIGPNGAVENQVFEKLAGTLMPASGCSGVPCSSSVHVEIPLQGATPGARAKSAVYQVQCAF